MADTGTASQGENHYGYAGGVLELAALAHWLEGSPAETVTLFAPLGSALVTLDELLRWPALPIRCRLKGKPTPGRTCWSSTGRIPN